MRKIVHKTKNRRHKKHKKELRKIQNNKLNQKDTRVRPKINLCSPKYNLDELKHNAVNSTDTIYNDYAIDTKHESSTIDFILYCLTVNALCEDADPRQGKNISYELPTFYIVTFLMLYYNSPSVNQFFEKLNSIELNESLTSDWLIKYFDIDNIPK
jgi:hypothetical protein